MYVTPDSHPVIFVDIDGVLCDRPEDDRDYEHCWPLQENIARVNALYDAGHTIILWTARGGTRPPGAEIHRVLLHRTQTQLELWNVKYHELRMQKPSYDLLIDDKATSQIPLVGSSPLPSGEQ